MQQSEYWHVNAALNAYFFDGRFSMMPVYLDLEGDAEEWVSAELKIDPKKLGGLVGKSVSETLRFDKRDPYFDHLAWLVKWNVAGRKNPPPFTALLCALSIAAERMGADVNFSANNYSERQFEVLSVHEAAHQQKLRQYAKSTRQFWRALNIWLSENDYELGRPTARQVNSWKYASYALSQALVRNADRERFPRLFEKMNLAPGEPITESEMFLYLHEWMRGEGPTSQLRKVWAVADLRERVVNAALDELAAWSPSRQVSGDSANTARFHWYLGFSGFPRRRARLALVAAAGKASEETVVLEHVSDKVVGRAFDDLDGKAELTTGSDDDYLVLGPTGKIDIGFLLLGSADFKGESSGAIYKYTAKPIIVFAKLEDGLAYREVQRASLFVEHAVMCHHSWLERMEAHLALCARPGYQVLHTDEMPGVPANWCILRGIEFVRSVDECHDNFHALNPITGAALIAALGGLRLGPSVWHSELPPRIEAHSDRDGATLTLVRETLGHADEDLSTVAARDDVMEAELEPGEALEGTNVRAVVSKGSAELAELGLSFRSANTPRPLGLDQVIYPIAADGHLLSSPSFVPKAELALGLQGTIIVGNWPNLQKVYAATVTGQAEVPNGEFEQAEQAGWKAKEGNVDAAPDSCVFRGYHYWRVEPFEAGDDKYESKRMECKTCGIQAMSRSRKGRWRKKKPTRAIRRVRISTQFLGIAEAKKELAAPLDTVYDGLCYLGRGGWSLFQRMAALVSDDAWYPAQLSSELNSLGHIDVIDVSPGRGREWHVAPPALVMVSGSTCYLAGFHSRKLVEAIEEAVTGNGRAYVPVTSGERVTIHRWENVSLSQLQTMVGDVRDSHGRSLIVVPSPGARIAANLNVLGAYFKSAPVVHIETRAGTSRFNPLRARWEGTNSATRPGAYKVDLHGVRYVYRDESGVTRETGFAMAKILAARAERLRLHSYDLASKVFTCALGCEPPGLFGRALVTSSGLLPERVDGRVLYREVPPEVGQLVLEKLYGE